MYISMYYLVRLVDLSKKLFDPINNDNLICILYCCFFFPFTSVDQAASILKSAKKPVILIGSQAVLPPISAEKLKETLEVFFIIFFIIFLIIHCIQ